MQTPVGLEELVSDRNAEGKTQTPARFGGPAPRGAPPRALILYQTTVASRCKASNQPHDPAALLGGQADHFFRYAAPMTGGREGTATPR
jgi:hypothetical protein